MPRWAGLVAAIAAFLTVVGSVLAMVAADLKGASTVPVAAAAMCAYILVGRVVVHEAGHLLAAVLVRLPVAAVRLRLVGAPSRVDLSVPTRGRWLSR